MIVKCRQTVVPHSPIQAKGLLLASIHDLNPVIFMEHKILGRAEVRLLVSNADRTLLAVPLTSLALLVPEAHRHAHCAPLGRQGDVGECPAHW
jgi:hypothetical protein